MAKASKLEQSPTEEPTSKTSFLLKDSLTHKLKYIALMDKTSQTKLVDEALSKLVAEWEKKHGKIPG